MLALTLGTYTNSNASNLPPTRAQELLGFLFISVVLAPVVAGFVITSYGFLVWMVQLALGPPGS